MLDYARSDTHYLLYIYDNLRNALLDRGLSASRSASRSGSPSATSPAPTAPPDAQTDAAPRDPHALLHEVHARSATTALRTHEREAYDAAGGAGPGGWDALARKWNKGVLMAGADGLALGTAAPLQRAVYRAVHAWRDAVAREDDESTRCVAGLLFCVLLGVEVLMGLVGQICAAEPLFVPARGTPAGGYGGSARDLPSGAAGGPAAREGVARWYQDSGQGRPRRCCRLR